MTAITKASENSLKINYWWLVDNPHTIYSRLVNVQPVVPPYSTIKRPHRFYLRTRRWRKNKLSSMIIYIKSELWNYEAKDIYTWEDFDKVFFWKFTDIISNVEIVNNNPQTLDYYMRISEDKQYMKIFKTENWCHLYEIYSDCFCNCGFEYFMPMSFLKWKPRNLYKDSWWNVLQIWWSYFDWMDGVQKNNWYYEKKRSLWELYDNDVDDINVLWNYSSWNNPIQIWDYIYTYETTSSATQWDTWICWQTNIVSWVDWKSIFTSNYWNWFDPWQINPDSRNSINQYFDIYWTLQWLDNKYYVSWREPQREWTNMKYMIFPDYWETFAFATCEWIKAFHYHSFDDFNNTAVVSKFCNFEWCFTDWAMYTGKNWISHAVYLNSSKNAILYSDWWSLWYLWAWNILPVKQSTYWMTSFQDYVVYFGKQHIWAFYITASSDKSAWVTRYITEGNIVRNNLWAWINPNWRASAFTEYNNSLYFIGSNKRLYALSIISNTPNTWKLVSKLEDMTDKEFGKRIIWDLDKINESDYVYLQADDDELKIFINSSNNEDWNPHKTKILTYWKRRDFRTTDISCCAVISNERNTKCGKIMFWDSIYHECWDFDCWEVPVEFWIEWYVWEDEVSKLEWSHSFNTKTIDYIKTQIWLPTKVIMWDTLLEIIINWNGKKTIKVIPWIMNCEYIQMSNNIRNWVEVKPTQCFLDWLSDCEYIDYTWKWMINYKDNYEYFDWNSTEVLCNWYNFRSCWWECACPQEKRIDDFCFSYDNKKYHLADFANIFSQINVKWELVKFTLRWHDDIWFWWWFMWVDLSQSPTIVYDSNKVNCSKCNTNIEYNKQSCF